MARRDSHPPHHHHHHHHRARRHSSPDRSRVEAMLTPWIPDPEDRSFVARCLVEEGPPHHRGASLALLALLQRALDRAPARDPAAPPGPTVPVHLRLPPHLRESLAPPERAYPMAMPTAALGRCLPDPGELAGAVESLADGPPHHALANALMVAMLDELLRRLGDAP